MTDQLPERSSVADESADGRASRRQPVAGPGAGPVAVAGPVDDRGAVIAGLRQGIADLMREGAQGTDDPSRENPGLDDATPADPVRAGGGPEGSDGPRDDDLRGAGRRGRDRSARSARSSGAAAGRRARRRGAVTGPPSEAASARAGADPEQEARAIVLRRLSERPRTRHELAQALQRRDVPDEVAARVLDRMVEVGLVDDAGYAAAYVESTQQRRHLSRRRLRQDLRRRGVGADEIEDAVAGVDDEDEFVAARELASRRYRTIAHLGVEVRRRRIGQALQRRGFAPALIRRVLDAVEADHEEITNITAR